MGKFITAIKGMATGTVMLVIGCGIIAALVIGFWQAGWWFTGQNVNRRAHIVQNQYNTQEGYLSAISNDVGQLDGIVVQEPSAPNQAALRAQAVGVAGQACLEANLLTGSVPVPASMAAWITTNCTVGALSPTSNIRTGGNGE